MILITILSAKASSERFCLNDLHHIIAQRPKLASNYLEYQNERSRRFDATNFICSMRLITVLGI